MNKVKTLPNINNRFKTGILIFFYSLITIVLAVFADPRTQFGYGWVNFIPKGNVGQSVSFTAALLLLAMYGWMSYYIAKELNSVFLHSNKKTDLILLSVSLYLIQAVPTIIFILPTYNIVYFSLGDDLNILTYIFIGSSSILPIIVYFVCLNMIKKSANNTKFNIIVFPLLVVILGWSFEWFYYLSIIRYWTTIFVLVGAVFINDMSGYFGGVLLGKHKLAPQISPKKTWEGAIFSVLGTILFVVITMLVFSHVNCYTKDNYDNPCSAFFGQQLPSEYWNFTNSTGWWIVIIVITLIYSIVSINADLLFSLIKRKNNVKDFSTFLKGHGGLLDRIDSLSLSISAFGVITTLIAFICSYFADNNCVFPLFSTEMGSLCVY